MRTLVLGEGGVWVAEVGDALGFAERLARGSAPDVVAGRALIAYTRRDRLYVRRSAADSAVPNDTAEAELVRGARPDWSPEGSELLFDRRGNIHAYALADGAVRRLTNDGADWDANWSPDGRKILFVRRAPDGGASETVWVMRADGSGARPLIRYAVQPDWQPVSANG